MKLQELKRALAAKTEAEIRFQLPTGSKLPVHCHITEVARVEKKFIDCGGTARSDVYCQFQIWSADDTDHRLTSAKLLAILSKSAVILGHEDPEVNVECEAPFASQFPLSAIKTENNSLVFELGIRHTACLAEDRCLPPAKPAALSFLFPLRR